LDYDGETEIFFLRVASIATIGDGFGKWVLVWVKFVVASVPGVVMLVK
jgi:hypothetical protein